MPELVEMDEKNTLLAQMEKEVGAIVLINTFTVQPEVAERFLARWAEDAAIMKGQPGFISAQMHKGVGDSRVFLNYAVWESVADFKRALNNPEFQAKMREYPPGVVASPHLFRKIAVRGICVD